MKFTSSQLSLGHEEGLCEAAYLSLAQQAGIDVPTWRLLPAPLESGAERWLALQRFDTHETPNQQEGRYHCHSACGLLGADFRVPSLDYEDLIKASSMLCKSPLAGQLQFQRAMFNLFAINQDDHSKNWAFLMGEKHQWQPAPFYDVTFSPSPYSEHSTAYSGFGKQPPLKTIQKLANQANFSNWQEAKQGLVRVLDALSGFSLVAKELGVSSETVNMLQKQLDQVYQDNRQLIV